MPTPKSKGTRRVRFEFVADPGSEVFVTGTFNGWNPDAKQLKNTPGTGPYTATLMLPKGRHEYKFVVNGVWCIDPKCTDWAPNNFGSLNSVLVVE